VKIVLNQNGEVVLGETPAPTIEPGHVLVEVAYSLISAGTEISTLQNAGKSLLKQVVEQPERIKQVIDYYRRQGINKTVAIVKERIDISAPLGYSCSGIVLHVGAGVKDIVPGDRIACAGAGFANHAELVLVPRNLVVKVPKECSLRDAASVTIGSIVMQGIRRADSRLGEIVAVYGLGLLGQITVQLLKAAGCRVLGIDLDTHRAAVAKSHGAEIVYIPGQVDILQDVMKQTDNHGVDATIITAASSSDEIVQQAMEITRKKGRVVVVGAVGLGLKRSPFYEKEIDFLISCSYGPGRYDERYEQKGYDYPYAYVRWTENRNMQSYLTLIADKKIQLDRILDREYEIGQVQQAYLELKDSPIKPLGIILSYPVHHKNDREDKRATKVVLRSGQTKGKIRLALIGAGSFAKDTHLPNLLKLTDIYHLRAIVDASGLAAQKAAQKFNADYASTYIQDVLEDDQVDMVLIATRHNTHAKLALQAAKAGKAIFVEKPMALNQTELDELFPVLEGNSIPFMVGFNRRFSPTARIIKEAVESRQNPLILTYRVNAGYLPPEHWTQSEEGGGRIIGEACHFFDLFQYLIDCPVSHVDVNRIVPNTPHILSDDNLVVMMRYEDGSVANLIYTALGSRDFGKEYLEVFCDGNVLVLDDYRSLKIFGANIKGWRASQAEKGHFEELRAFGNFLLGESNAPISLTDMANTTKLSFIVAESKCQ
jgi:predicted dehydrogenase/threonine dehydrogenase-like Zn-dependent dehydrogenase